MGLHSQVEEASFDLQTATATGATPAGSATTGKVRAASSTCCLLSIDEVEVEVEVEGLQKASVGKEEVTAEV